MDQNSMTIEVVEAERKNPAPFFSSNSISVIMAFNDEYAPFAGVTILSILKNSSQFMNYDIIIFDGKISDRNKTHLNKIVSDFENAKIRYFDPDPIFGGFSLPYRVWSREIYYRLYIPKVFSDFDRVIYLDADTLVNSDISNLFNVDMGGKSIGAVFDFGMAMARIIKSKSPPGTGEVETDIYLKSVLGLKNLDEYFNSGVLLFDIKKCDKYMNDVEKILCEGFPYWFPDQDIFNKLYQGDVYYLDDRWNAFSTNGQMSALFKERSKSIYSKFIKSQKDPFIIHYAGPAKPWKCANFDFLDYFWIMARNTPWYELILLKAVNGGIWGEKIGLRDILRAFANPIAPHGTTRRKIMRKIFRIARKIFIRA
jgi:lipopolysaccharide biosynthesis glycosyltransferase